MGIKIKYGKSVGALAIASGRAAYKRTIQAQNFEMARMASSQMFQERMANLQAEQQAERDYRMSEIQGQQAADQFERQKELTNLHSELQMDAEFNRSVLNLAQADELGKMNMQRKQEMDQYEYDLTQKRRLAEVDKARQEIDRMVQSGRYSEDDPDIIQARADIEFQAAGVHMKAIPKPRPDPQREVAQNVAQFDMPDGTKQTFYRTERGWVPMKGSDANREAVTAKMIDAATKSFEGRVDANGSAIPATEDEIYARAMMMMRIRDKMMGRQVSQDIEGIETPVEQKPAEGNDLGVVGSAINSVKSWVSNLVGNTKPPASNDVKVVIEGRLSQLPEGQRQQIEEERDRIMARLKWAKGAGAYIEYQKAKEELRALIMGIGQPQVAVQPPREMGVQ